MKPVILITASLDGDESFLKINRAYTKAVERAGGTALIPDCSTIDNIQRLLEIADGVLLTGGGDIDPFFFNESPIPEIGAVSPERDEFEIELARLAAERNVPVLAICRGAQVLNVALGGNVYQDIYSQTKKPLIKHSQDMPKRYASHAVSVKDGSVLKRIVGHNKIRVNSFHHQAVSELGDGLIACAYAEDGVIEAIEHSGLSFCLGVQWHPEHMTHIREQFELFSAFIGAAQ